MLVELPALAPDLCEPALALCEPVLVELPVLAELSVLVELSALVELPALAPELCEPALVLCAPAPGLCGFVRVRRVKGRARRPIMSCNMPVGQRKEQ